MKAVFSFWQEFKAEQATESLKKMLPSYVKVIRNGHQQKILARELVSGDLIYLEGGDYMPHRGCVHVQHRAIVQPAPELRRHF